MLPGQYFTEVQAYRFKNFMAFQDTGWINNRPITLVFGRNSTGKSALIKGLRLLKQSLTDGSRPLSLLFYDKEGVDLGGFKTTVHQQNNSLSIGFEFKLDIPSDSWFNVEGWSFEDYLTLCYEFSYSQDHVFLSQISVYADDDDPDRSMIIQLSTDGHKWNRRSTFFDLEQGEYASIWQQSQLFERRGFLVYLGSAISESGIGGSGITVDERSDEDVDPFQAPEPPEVFLLPSDQIKDYRISDPHLKLAHVSSESATNDELVKQPAPKFSDIANILQQMQNIIENYLDSLVHVGPVRPFPERYNLIRWPFTDSFIGKIILYARKDDEYLDRLNDWLLNHSSLDISVNVQRLSSSTDVPLYQLEITEKDRTESLRVSLQDVGSGISQLLPILVEAANLDLSQLLIIEQPELHLHPKAQMTLADLFIEAVRKSKKRFFIETHSEHLLLRFRYHIADTHLKLIQEEREFDENQDFRSEQFAVYFVDRDKGVSTVEQIKIKESGEFAHLPEGFKEFFADDAKQVMDITSRLLKAQILQRRKK